MPGPSPSNPRRFTWLKLAVCLAVVALLATAFWTRRLPGRPVSPEWARGGSSPDNSLTYETEDDSPASRAPDADVLSSPDFLFTMGEGSGMLGYDVIQIWPDGKCEYSYPDARPGLPARAVTGPATTSTTSSAALTPWRRATFHVDPATVADLRRLLVDTGYFGLKKSYYATNVNDGTQWFIRARAGGREKALSCNNHFPADAIRINDFVRTRVIHPNRGAVSGATPVDLPTDWLPDF